jgi:hypothetical protein
MRQLVPHYYVSTRPLGWKCSDCGQVFGNRVPQDGEEQSAAPTAAIHADFADHNCESHRAQVKAHRQSLGV